MNDFCRQRIASRVLSRTVRCLSRNEITGDDGKVCVRARMCICSNETMITYIIQQYIHIMHHWRHKHWQHTLYIDNTHYKTLTTHIILFNIPANIRDEHWRHTLCNNGNIHYVMLATYIIQQWQHTLYNYWKHTLCNIDNTHHATLTTYIMQQRQHTLYNVINIHYATLKIYIIQHWQHTLCNIDNIHYATTTTCIIQH